MLLNASLPPYGTAIIISAIVLQYVFALFCLMKLAYFDISKKQFVLWNFLILIVFFIGGIIFLVYYSKHPEKKISVPVDEVPGSQEEALADNVRVENGEEQVQTGKEETSGSDGVEEEPDSDGSDGGI